MFFQYIQDLDSTRKEDKIYFRITFRKGIKLFDYATHERQRTDHYSICLGQ